MRYFSGKILAVALFFLLGCTTSALAQNVVDRIVAVVNGDVITLFELNQRFRPVLEQFEGQELRDEDKAALLEAKRQLLDRMVEEMLLRQEAERLDMNVSDLELQTQIRQVRERMGVTESQFQEYLTLQGMDREMYESRMREEMLRHRLLGFMIRRKVVVTSDEVRDYYQANKQNFIQQRRVRIGLILFASPSQAEEVREALRTGETTFAEAARAYSQGPGADQGGDMGLMDWQDLAANWQEALDSLNVGEISSIIRIQNNSAVLKLLAEEPGESKPLAEVEDQIREILMEPRLEARYDEYMQALRSRSLIDIRL